MTGKFTFQNMTRLMLLLNEHLKVSLHCRLVSGPFSIIAGGQRSNLGVRISMREAHYTGAT